jgi:hypothetical protein
MMHRFWGDCDPEYGSRYGYQSDPVFSGFVTKALKIADEQIAVCRRFVDTNPGWDLVVASSMGQGPIPYVPPVGGLLALTEPDRLLRALELSGRPGLAMYPMCAISIGQAQKTLEAERKLASLTDRSGRALLSSFAVRGESLTFAAVTEDSSGEIEPIVSAEFPGRQWTLKELGFEVRDRLGGTNTAYHIPDGILIHYRPGIKPDDTRRVVDLLDVAPSLLVNLMGIEAPETMRGRPRADVLASAGSLASDSVT